MTFQQTLRDIYENKNFATLLAFKDEVIKRWDKQNTIGESEFETLKMTMEKEFKKLGLDQFFDELEKEISKDA